MSTVKIPLEGSNSNVVGKIGYGLMTITLTPHPLPYDAAFEIIKGAIDALPTGVKMFLNSAEFYDNNFSYGNLDLLAAFFEKYPDYADKTFLSVKGGLGDSFPKFDASRSNLRRRVDAVNEHLRGFKKLDLFQCARVDPKVPIEDQIKTLAELIKEGKFDYIGLSEASAATLARANKVHPIAAIEIEVSPWSYEEETKKVIATAKELGVVVAAYSPLGHGFLTGQIKSRADLPSGDMRLSMTRFSDENFKVNLKIVDELTAIAAKKEITSAQLCLAWISALGPHVLSIPGSTKMRYILQNIAAGNIRLTAEEFEAVNKAIADNQVVGDRSAGGETVASFWG